MGISDRPAASKRWGQNFLVDANIVRKMVSLSALSPNDSVLEIGPGRGILTAALCQSAGHVTAIEIDPRLHAYVSEQLAFAHNLRLVLGDALSYPLEELPIGTAVVANLPYSISTPLLFRLLEHRNQFPRMVLMLQDEVADRLVAKPGTKDYGVLSVTAQYAAAITKAFKVSPNCFRPRPDVRSAVVMFRSAEPRDLSPDEAQRFRRLVKAAFAHRRKTLINSLTNEGYDQGMVLEALREMGLSSDTRAEALSVADFIGLTRLIPLP